MINPVHLKRLMSSHKHKQEAEVDTCVCVCVCVCELCTFHSKQYYNAMSLVKIQHTKSH